MTRQETPPAERAALQSATAHPTPAGPAHDRPRVRQDHERNRRRIITAARELFATHGRADVQLKDVAVTAGVSQATLFRHIGSKQALLVMTYSERIGDVIETATQAATAPDPWDGVITLVRTLAEWVNGDRGLWEFTTGDDVVADPQYPVMLERIEQVLGRARADGSLRAEVGALDLMALLGCAAGRQADRWTAYTDVLLGGLRSPYQAA